MGAKGVVTRRRAGGAVVTALERPQRPALWCGAEHPIADGVLCRRLSGHGGTHSADEDTAWDEWDCVVEGSDA